MSYVKCEKYEKQANEIFVRIILRVKYFIMLATCGMLDD